MTTKRFEDVVRDTLADLDEDDDLYDKLKGSEAFSELLGTIIREDSTVREAIAKALKKCILGDENTDSAVGTLLDDDPVLDDKIKEIIKEDEKIKDILRDAVKKYLFPKNEEDSPVRRNLEDSGIDDAVTEALEHDDSKAALREAIAQAFSREEFLRKFIKEYDLSGDDYSKEIGELIKTNPDVQSAFGKRVATVIDEGEIDDEIARTLNEDVQIDEPISNVFQVEETRGPALSALGKRVASVIDDGEADGKIVEGLSETDLNEPIAQALKTTEAQAAFQKRVAQCVEDSDELPDAIRKALRGADLSNILSRMLSTDRLSSTLEGAEINQETLLPAVIEALGKTEIFKEYVTRSLEKIARLGRLDTLIERLVEKVITGQESKLLENLEGVTLDLMKDIFLRGIELYKKEQKDARSGSFYR